MFSLTWPEAMTIHWNKRKCIHEKRVPLTQDGWGTQNGCRLTVLVHQYSCRGVVWKHSICTMSLLRNEIETDRMTSHKATMSQESYNKLETLDASNIYYEEGVFWSSYYYPGYFARTDHYFLADLGGGGGEWWAIWWVIACARIFLTSKIGPRK